MSDIQALFSKIDPSQSINQLFELIPGLMFFVKNVELKIIMANQEFAQHCGYSSADQLSGLSDAEIFPAYMANKFHADDLDVLNGGNPLLNLIELFPTREGLPEWFITQKLPLRDPQNKVVAICGVIQSYERILDYSNDPIYQLVDHIRQNYANRISVPEIARIIGISTRQLERRFNTVFRTSPRKYIVRLRLLIASDKLRGSDTPITEIAHECGFYDHSSFIRHFKTTFDTTPLAFRKRFRE